MAIVYRHRRLDTNKVFYIGIGKEESRAFDKRSRNKLSGKIIVCRLTNKKWFNIRDCANENNLNRNTLKSRLNGRLKNNTTFYYDS